jgi:hypothetical protein
MKILVYVTKPKPDADVTKTARNSIPALQSYSKIKMYWVEGHADKRGPSFSPQEELHILNDGLATKSQTALPPDMKPRTDCLNFPEQQISLVIQHRRVTSHLP